MPTGAVTEVTCWGDVELWGACGLSPKEAQSQGQGATPDSPRRGKRAKKMQVSKRSELGQTNCEKPLETAPSLRLLPAWCRAWACASPSSALASCSRAPPGLLEVYRRPRAPRPSLRRRRKKASVCVSWKACSFAGSQKCLLKLGSAMQIEMIPQQQNQANPSELVPSCPQPLL
jgi:hypothetical protein